MQFFAYKTSFSLPTNLPDRRRFLIDDALESGVYALSTGNDISREWIQLDEHILPTSTASTLWP